VVAPGRPDGSGSPVSSVANAARVLKEFRYGRSELGVTEIARRVGVGKSTAHRLVNTLVQEQLLEQDPRTGLYQLTVTVFDLGTAVPIRRELHGAALPVLEALRRRTHESVQIGVRGGREVYYLARVETPHTMHMLSRLGHRNWLHCTASGKVLLAGLSTDELDELLHGWRLPRRTPGTVTDHRRLRTQLDDVRGQGFALTVGEADEDSGGLAAPIRTGGGHTIAALSVVAPAQRVAQATVRSLSQLVIEGAAAIANRLDGAVLPE